MTTSLGDSRPRAMRRYIATTVVVAAVTVAFAWACFGPPNRFEALVVLVALAIASRIGPRNEVESEVLFSILSVVMLAAIPLCGPIGATAVGLIGSLARGIRLPRRALLFNASMYALLGAAGGMVYGLLGGTFDPTVAGGAAHLAWTVGLPLLAADIVMCVANAGLVSGASHYWSGSPFRAHLLRLLGRTGLAYVAYGLIAVLLVVLWLPARVGPLSALLILAPLLVARWASAQYGGEVLAHERTLNALVAAMDVKVPGLARASELSAEVSAWMAEELSWAPSDVEAAQRAGRLHRVWVLAVSPVRDRPGSGLGSRATGDRSGAVISLVAGISFLDRALPGIASARERFDGTGMPEHLEGEQIPEVARLVSVAGSFAEHVVRTGETGTALDAIKDGAGAAYDPVYVAALDHALQRHASSGTLAGAARGGAAAPSADSPRVTDR